MDGLGGLGGTLDGGPGRAVVEVEHGSLEDRPGKVAVVEADKGSLEDESGRVVVVGAERGSLEDGPGADGGIEPGGKTFCGVRNAFFLSIFPGLYMAKTSFETPDNLLNNNRFDYIGCLIYE